MNAVFYSDKNLLIFSPAGSVKTLIADIAMPKVFSRHQKGRKRKIIYLNTKDITVNYKYRNWRTRIGNLLGKKAIIFNGNQNDDNNKAFSNCDIIVSRADKFYS